MEKGVKAAMGTRGRFCWDLIFMLVDSLSQIRDIQNINLGDIF